MKLPYELIMLYTAMLTDYKHRTIMRENNQIAINEHWVMEYDGPDTPLPIEERLYLATRRRSPSCASCARQRRPPEGAGRGCRGRR